MDPVWSELLDGWGGRSGLQLFRGGDRKEKPASPGESTAECAQILPRILIHTEKARVSMVRKGSLCVDRARLLLLPLLRLLIAHSPAAMLLDRTKLVSYCCHLR